ncbi:MAG: HAD-IIA family hydrolase [Deltaproteobacteria bacterium]|nr:HAD-IIA family hydrolase [Deltaproteobacteria bacterium]
MQRLSNVRCFLLDMDGTVNLGNRPLNGASKFFATLSQKGISHIFLTNNSSRTAAEYERKLSSMGLPAGPGSVYTSGDATIEYLKRNNIGPKLFVLGTRSLRKRFEDEGFVMNDTTPSAVILGFDMELTYDRVRTACRLISSGVRYIATHPDLVCPVEEGFIPDAGSIAEMIAAGTNGKRPVIIGKPEPGIITAALDRIGINPEQAAVVGDRLYTDIAAGKRANVLSILVLSGETTLDMLSPDEKNQPQSIIKSEYPDLVFNDIGELADALDGEKSNE